MSAYLGAPRLPRITVRHGSRIADELLAKVRRQPGLGPEDEKRYRLTTGLTALDERVPTWTSVTLLFGPDWRPKSALLYQIAFETARAGKPVLWLCAAGRPERALLAMMTRRARLPLPRVSVKWDLRPGERRRLERAAAELSRLPLRFADVHGANGVELEDTFCSSLVESGEEHQLVVLDRLSGAGRVLLQHLERLSDVVRVPFLVALESHGEHPDTTPTTSECGLRPGSRVLFVTTAPDWKSRPPRTTAGRELLVYPRAVGDCGRGVPISLQYDEAGAAVEPFSIGRAPR